MWTPATLQEVISSGIKDKTLMKPIFQNTMEEKKERKKERKKEKKQRGVKKKIKSLTQTLKPKEMKNKKKHYIQQKNNDCFGD